MKKFKPGDIAYIIVNNREVSKVRIMRVNGSMYVVRFFDSDGGIQVRESRLYLTQFDALHALPNRTREENSHWLSHYAYEWQALYIILYTLS